MKNFTKILETRIGFWREFAIGVAIAVAARGSMLFPLNFSEDTYRFLNYPQSGNIFELCASELRVFSYFGLKILEFIGADFPFAGAFWPILFSASLVLAGLLSMRIWVPNGSSAIMVTGASMFCLFPYNSDYATFHNVAPLLTTMFIVGWISIYFGLKNRIAKVAGIFGIAYAVSAQITFVFLFSVVFFEGMIWAFKTTKSAGWGKKGLLESAKPWLGRLGLLIIGTLLYLIVSKAIMVIYGIPSGSRLQLSGIEEYPAKLVLYAKQCYYFLFSGEVSMPLGVKIIQLSIFSVVLASGILAWKSWDTKKIANLFLWGFFTGVVVIGIGICMGIMLPMRGEAGMMNLRTLSSLGVYWTGVFALGCAVVPAKAKIIPVTMGILLVVSYAANANRQAVDHARINQRDRLVANRIVERLSLNPKFESLRTVVVLGTSHRFNLDRITTETNGFNISALYRPWSSHAVLREVSGIPFEWPTPADYEIAESAAIGKPEWPAPGSVFIEGDVGVVVLPRPEK